MTRKQNGVYFIIFKKGVQRFWTVQNYDVKVFTIHFVLTWQLSITTFCPYIWSKRKPIWLPFVKITHQCHHWQQFLSLLELVVGIPFARQNFQRKKILFCLYFLLYSPKSLYPLFKNYYMYNVFLWKYHPPIVSLRQIARYR
jgi:hypothetical protein